jgi:glycosyltransferase involved in cell wall biosynthesis
MPLVSAVITTFNRKFFLEQAINSVLSQSFSDYELIVLYNDSTDGTEEFLKKLNHNNKIKYLKHQNINISQQRNLAVSLARGKYIAFLDDDDIWLKDKLENQVSTFNKSDKSVALVYSGFCFYDDQGKVWGHSKPSKKNNYFMDLLWEKSHFSGSASNPMLRLSAVKSSGLYDEKIRCGEDWELYVRLARRFNIEIDANISVKIRQHSGPRLGQNILAALHMERRAYFKNYNFMSNELKSRYLQKIGGKYIRLGFLNKGRRIILASINSNRLNWASYFQLFLTFLPFNLYIFFHSKYITVKKMFM